MIKHIVTFKVNDKTKIEEAKEKIEALKEVISEIKHIEVGIDMGFDPTASDFVIYSEFETKEKFSLYASHPKHLEVIAFIKTIAKQREVVDYVC